MERLHFSMLLSYLKDSSKKKRTQRLRVGAVSRIVPPYLDEWLSVFNNRDLGVGNDQIDSIHGQIVQNPGWEIQNLRSTLLEQEYV